MNELSSLGVAPRDRAAWWAERVRDEFGTSQQIDVTEGAEFRIRLRSTQVSALRAVHVAGSAHRSRGEAAAADHVRIRLQEAGSARFEVGSRSAEVSSGSLMVVPPHGRNDFQFASDYEQVSVSIPAAMLSEVCRNWSGAVMQPIATDTGAAALLAAHMRTLERVAPSLGAEGAAMADVTVNLVAATLRAARGTCELESASLRSLHRERARNYVRLHLRNPDLCPAQVAAGIGVSVRYLHLIFSDEGDTLMRWTMQQRMERCREALVAFPQRKISDIALEFGFSDHAHFTRLFRRTFGMSPSDARVS